MTKEIDLEKLIEQAMIVMVVEYHTLAYMISKIGVEVVDNPSVPAAAYTNGQGIYINKYAINKMNEMKTETGYDGKTYNVEIGKGELVFILAHELMHLLNNTYERGERIGILADDFSPKGKAKNELWNMATDFEINDLLYSNHNSDNKPRPIGTKPDWVCWDSKYSGMPAEKIYEDLLQNSNMDMNGNMQFKVGNMQFTFDTDSQQGGQGQDNNNSEGGDGNSQQGNGKPNDKQGNGLSFGLDKHMPFVDEQTKAEVMAKVAEVMGGKSQGTGMSAFDRALEIAFKPEPFNWRRALTRYIKSFMKDNYTWNKPSRAGIANGLILPSPHQTPKIHVAVAVDTSGSIGDKELRLLLNHVFTILSQFKAFTVDVWCCSTMVHEDTFMTLTAANKSDINKFHVESTGGTDMSANLPFIKKKYAKQMPDVVMIFTDGFDNLNGDTETRTPYPVIWLIVDNKDFKKPSKMPGAVYEFSSDA